MNSKVAQAFLEAAFGFQDADSGYGAHFPRSRDIRNFFEGRHGVNLPAGGALRFKSDGPYIISQHCDVARAVADDLEYIAKEIRDLCEDKDQ